MNKLLQKINTKNIEELYQIENITTQGIVLLKDKKIAIYKIDPTNIIACDEQTKLKIVNAYRSCIRGLSDNFQIIISKEKANLNEQIQQYKLRLSSINNEGLKIALKKYIKYLENIGSLSTLYKTSYYLIIENTNENDLEDILEIFANLKEFGIRISRIKSCQTIKNIMQKYINKELSNEVL